MPADTESHNSDFPLRHPAMFGEPIQAGSAIGIEMRDRSLRSVLLAASPSGVIEGDNRSRGLDAAINFRRRNNKSIPSQTHARS
jgi:hypothetical protein